MRMYYTAIPTAGLFLGYPTYLERFLPSPYWNAIFRNVSSREELAQRCALRLHAHCYWVMLEQSVWLRQIIFWFIGVEKEFDTSAAKVCHPAKIWKDAVNEDIIDAGKKRHVGGHVTGFVWGLLVQ